jgi:hypothetical protein
LDEIFEIVNGILSRKAELNVKWNNPIMTAIPAPLKITLTREEDDNLKELCQARCVLNQNSDRTFKNQNDRNFKV